MNDTKQKMQRIVDEMIMRKSGIERLKMGASMFESAKRLVLASLDSADDRSKKIEIFIRFYKNDFSEEKGKKIINYFNSLTLH